MNDKLYSVKQNKVGGSGIEDNWKLLRNIYQNLIEKW